MVSVLDRLACVVVRSGRLLVITPTLRGAHRDTVSSLGVKPSDNLHPFVTPNPIVRILRHALSLDEHRHRFLPVHPLVVTQASKHSHRSHNVLDSVSDLVLHEAVSYLDGVRDSLRVALHLGHSHTPPTIMHDCPGRPFMSDRTNVMEVWFAGDHSGASPPPRSQFMSHGVLNVTTHRSTSTDVGGGHASGPDGSVPSLARISLRWMVLELFRANAGVWLDVPRLRTIGMGIQGAPHAVPLGPVAAVGAWWTPVVDRAEEGKDAFCKVHDELAAHTRWWFLEVMSVPVRQLGSSAGADYRVTLSATDTWATAGRRSKACRS